MSDQRMMMMMNWDGLGVDDEFLDSFDRISSVRFSSAVPFNIHSSGSGSDDDDEFYDDNRMSFASAISAPPKEFLNFTAANVESEDDSNSISNNYDIWMAEPGSIKERRKRLLQGMGLNSNKELLKRVISRSSSRAPESAAAKAKAANEPKKEQPKNEPKQLVQQHYSSSSTSPSSSPSPALPLELFKIAFTQSRSDGDISTAAYQDSKNRKEQLIGDVPIRKLIRSSSAPSTFCHLELPIASMKQSKLHSRIRSMKSIGGPRLTMSQSNVSDGTFFIKNLDTGKEFTVNDGDSGRWNKLSDTQTGEQVSMEELEQSVGHSPIVKELMRRESVVGEHEAANENNEKATTTNGQNDQNGQNCKSGKPPKKRGVGWFKNVANSINGFMVDKEKEPQPALAHQTSTRSVAPSPTSQWTKVRQHGKSQKELTGLYMCQEIQAHQGSIWSIKFSHDARYLASAGEDRVIHIWEVMDFDALMSRSPDEGKSSPEHPVEGSHSEDQPPVAEVQPMPQEKKKKGKSSSNKKKGSTIPDYIVVPETLFSFSEKPICTFQGHLDDVLDLSWSHSQQLLSSSMDKTVRLWDMETKTCLKLFAHNDYVTCIQFNPIDDSYFISGSLDAKVRIWSIPDRQVVDWTDLNEMVTAACYTPDGQGAMVGSHKGTCRAYDISESKLNQKELISVQNKKKSQGKKITGFEFDPGNPSDMLISSADSRIRIFDGTSVTQNFRGFRNTNSQISASFTADGKYVLCASEDSQVYIWKRDEIRNVVSWKGNKGFVTTQSHEHFECKDVSVAVPWPGSIKCDPSLLSMRSKRYADLSNSRRTPTGEETAPGEEASTSAANTSNKKRLPPLPAKKNGATEKAATKEKTAATEKAAEKAETKEKTAATEKAAEKAETTEKAATAEKAETKEKPETTEKAATSPEEELANGSQVESGISDSPSLTSASSSSSSSLKYGNSPSISASSSASSSSTRWLEDSNIQNTAWGMVIVTAGSGGEIRTYQNLGLPLRLNRQISLFRDYSLNSGSAGGSLYFR